MPPVSSLCIVGVEPKRTYGEPTTCAHNFFARFSRVSRSIGKDILDFLSARSKRGQAKGWSAVPSGPWSKSWNLKSHLAKLTQSFHYTFIFPRPNLTAMSTGGASATSLNDFLQNPFAGGTVGPQSENQVQAPATPVSVRAIKPLTFSGQSRFMMRMDSEDSSGSGGGWDLTAEPGTDTGSVLLATFDKPEGDSGGSGGSGGGNSGWNGSGGTTARTTTFSRR